MRLRSICVYIDFDPVRPTNVFHALPLFLRASILSHDLSALPSLGTMRSTCPIRTVFAARIKTLPECSLMRCVTVICVLIACKSVLFSIPNSTTPPRCNASYICLDRPRPAAVRDSIRRRQNNVKAFLGFSNKISF